MPDTFLPFVGNGPTVAGEGKPDKARQVFDRMQTDPLQGRKGMVWNELLAGIALYRCARQGKEGWTGHVAPGGIGPNYHVRLLGYRLPSWYSQDDDANNCESLAHNGDGSVEGVWQAWMNSEHHRVHLLGLNDFYAGQVNVGVAFYEGGEKRFYWCVLTCHAEEQG